MGIVTSSMDRRVGTELSERGVLVWYDPARAWRAWIETTLGESSPGEEATAVQVTIGGRDAHLVVSTGSHYEVLEVCEPLVSGSEPPRLLVYIPGEPYLEMLSPLRELECLGGEKEPYQRELTQVARQALQSAGLSESKIDELLNRDGLDFAYLDSISIGDGGASPLAPVFGSSRELDVIPSFLTEPERRAEAADKGLLPEVARLASQGLGLQLSAEANADGMAQELSRVLLVAEMRSDLDGPEPVAIAKIVGPSSDEQVERVRAVCRKLRLESADLYESMADTVEQELGLAEAEINPETLGRIDTFRFEEQRLLEACNRRLANGEADRALGIVEDRLREGSFWTSVGRFPARHAAWEAAGALARLALEIDEVSNALEKPPGQGHEWVAAYTAPDGWHRVDQHFRDTRYRMSHLEDARELDDAAEIIFERYDSLVERMAIGFSEALQSGRWEVQGVDRQDGVFAERVAGRTDRVAYILADAMRFEMAEELGALMEAVGATAVNVEPRVAVAPTITDLGMVALLPGAERSFSIAETGKGIAGSIGGRPIAGASARMSYARGEIPALVEMTLNRLVNDLTLRQREQELGAAPIVVIRSQEIDGIGENLPEGAARMVMGTVLHDLRKAAQYLADVGIHHFVVVADHGHLFGARRGEDMKIDPPEGGQKVDLHRRCWVGRGGSTPSSCVRLRASELGYEGTDLDLVFPKGTGVFKAGGSLSYLHGGLSLQELIVPVLTFQLTGREAARKVVADLIALEGVPPAVNNLIFSFMVRRVELAMEPLELQFDVETQREGEKTTGGQAISASRGWDPETRILSLEAGERGYDPVSVGFQIDDEDADEVRVVAVQVGTQRALKDTSLIPVRVTR